eukprot:3880864-Prymnesium_polylepis.1
MLGAAVCEQGGMDRTVWGMEMLCGYGRQMSHLCTDCTSGATEQGARYNGVGGHRPMSEVRVCLPRPPLDCVRIVTAGRARRLSAV